MAVSTQIIVDGPRKLVVKLADSTGAGETDVLKVDVSGLSPPAVDLTLEKIAYTLSAGVPDRSVTLLWDATVNVPLLIVAGGDSGHLDFTKFGGIPNDAGAGKTGDILLTSVAGTVYSIVLYLKKKF